MEKIFRVSNSVYEYGQTMCSLDDVLQIVKFDKTTQKVCEALRSGACDDRKDEIKEMLKTIEFHSITENHRLKENVRELTGYVCMDLDDAGVDYGKLREDFANDTVLNPVLMFTSPSGKLKLLLHLQQLHNATVEEFYDYYKQCVIYIYEKHGIVADTKCNDPVRLCYISHDPDPYYNQAAPLCAIQFYPVGDEDVNTTYELLRNDKEKGYKTRNGSGYNDEMYKNWLARVKDDLVVDENGDYVRDTKREKVFIGSVSGGTAVEHGVGYLGYALKFRLSVCAMWLYDNNTQKAQQLVNDCFADANDRQHKWNRCSFSHSKFKPEKDVLLWFLKTFGFKSMFELPKTTFEFAQEIRADLDQRDATIAEKWFEISKEYEMPEILNLVMSDKTASNEVKDVMLYSALATMSGFAKNTFVRYNKANSGLNLTLNVIGSSASGKGYMSKQAGALLKSLDTFAQTLNAENYKNYKKELAEWKKWNAAKTNVDYGNGDLFPDGEPEQPVVVINQTNLATSSAWASVLKHNNGKMILINTEYSNIAKMESGRYGGLLSQMKNIFDNDPVGNLSATALAKGMVDTVQNPNCAVLLSGTFGQFKQLYTSFEDGLLTRSIYYIVPEKEFDLVPLWGDNQDKRELQIEKMFVGWYLWCHFGRKTTMVLCDDDFEKLRVVVNKFVNDTVKTYNLGDEVGNACAAMCRRFPHIVFKVAALLQSLKDYEKTAWNPDDNRTPLEMLQEQKVWYRSKFDGKISLDEEYTPEEWLMVQKNNYGFVIDNIEKEVFENPSPLPISLEYNWVEAAWKLLVPSLVYGLRMLGMYRKEDVVMGNVNPLKGQAKYMALKMCKNTFTFTDYKKMLDLVRKKDTPNVTVSKYLKQLETEFYVVKHKNGGYTKTTPESVLYNSSPTPYTEFLT